MMGALPAVFMSSRRVVVGGGKSAWSGVHVGGSGKAESSPEIVEVEMLVIESLLPPMVTGGWESVASSAMAFGGSGKVEPSPEIFV
jgi:hypothetical protein